MTRLSVNVNKVATIRNARGGNNPDLIKVALDIEKMGGEGITMHPRPDERHITRQDVVSIRPLLTTEFNIEGYPDQRFIDLVLEVQPDQVTLVPDAPSQITSNHGWDTTTEQNRALLAPLIKQFKQAGIRVSIFVDAEPRMVEGAHLLGADRVELYTEPYASLYPTNREEAIKPFIEAARHAQRLGLGLNAGHDLSLENLAYLKQQIPWIDEVSIGHALICDALYMGLQETINQYKQQLL